MITKFGRRQKGVVRAIKLDDVDHKIILIGIGLIILTALFPPWVYTVEGGRTGGPAIHSEKPAGYGFIFLPPLPESKNPAYGIRIAFGRMFLQWFLVAAICAAIIMYLHIEKNSGIIELKDIVSEEEGKRLTKEEIKETPERDEEWARKYIKDVLKIADAENATDEDKARAKRIKKEQ